MAAELKILFVDGDGKPTSGEPPVAPPPVQSTDSMSATLRTLLPTLTRDTGSTDLAGRIQELIENQHKDMVLSQTTHVRRDRIIDQLLSGLDSWAERLGRALENFGQGAIGGNVRRTLKGGTRAGRGLLRGARRMLASRTSRRLGIPRLLRRARKSVVGKAAMSVGMRAMGVAAGVAGPLIAIGSAAITATRHLLTMGERIHDAAVQLEEFAPRIAMIRSMFDTRRELMKADRARRLDAPASAVEAARGRVGEAWYELNTKLLELTGKFSPLIEGVYDGVTAGVNSLNVLFARLDVWQAYWTKGREDDRIASDKLLKAQKDFQKSFEDIWRQNDAFGDMDVMDPIFQQVLQMQVPAQPAGPAQGAAPPAGDRPLRLNQ